MALADHPTKTRTPRFDIPAPNIKTEIVTITPEIAAAWLDKNVHNRNVSGGVVQKFANDMKAGLWQMTGESIKFDVLGNLIDGQHRLLACKRAAVPFPAMVVYGLPTVAQQVLDSGKSRSTADALKLYGHNNASRLSTTLRTLIGYRDFDGHYCQARRSEVHHEHRRRAGLLLHEF